MRFWRNHLLRSPPRASLISVLLVGGVLLWHESLRRSALSFLRFPLTAAKTVVTVVVMLPRLPSLAQDNAGLRATLVQRELEMAQLREQLRRTAQSHVLLQVAPPAGGIVAEVLSRSPIPTQQTVLIDRGARDGVTLQSPIVDAFGVIGRVIDVAPSTALVLLLTDSESRVAALIERSRETGLLLGQARGECELVYLDAAADVQEGDRVVTAGLGGVFPKGLLLGAVTRVRRDDHTGAAAARVQPAARLGRLEEVLVLPAP